MPSETARSYLSTVPLFHDLGPEARSDLFSELEFVTLAGGEILFRAGDPGDALYVVLSGRLRILAERSGGGSEVLREIARGETVGELALLTGRPRSATARAIRDSELAKLPRAAFEQAWIKHPRMMSRLAVQIAERQSEATGDGRPARNIRTLAILPFDQNAPAADFVGTLVATLQSAGATLHLNRPLIESELRSMSAAAGDPGATTAHLNSLEIDHRFVVYEAEVEHSPWTERCIRQADLIFILAAANSEPSPLRLKLWSDYFARRHVAAPIELVLLHGGGFVAEVQANRWLSSLPVENYHHVIHPAPSEAAKLLRFLTGTAVGLVLSGGGARGFAHIGVIRALDECAIPIDHIGGTSMGAVIAAQYASGWDWQKMLEVNRETWPRCQPERNFTLPLVALNSAERMDRMLREMFGGVEIQNLRTKFFCVSTNLTRAEAMVHRSGLLWKSVRASMSIPGIGPPAIERGEIFVDGGLVNNLPVDVMKRLCPGPAIAVDVSEQAEFKSTLQESYTLSGWALLGQRLNPFAEKREVPNILNLLYRATTVGGIGAIAAGRALADLCIEPPVKGFGIFDWRKVATIVEAGYRHALAQLKRENDFRQRKRIS